MEIWYTMIGNIDRKSSSDAIIWINGQFYANPAISKLKFFISSNGGDIDSGLCLYDYLKALPFEVETIGFGQVDSAAISIFLGGKIRSSLKDCRFLLHEGTYHGVQDAPLHLHKENLKLFENLLRRTKKIIVENSGYSEADIDQVLRECTILTPEEAKDKGMVHNILDQLPKKTV